MSWPINNLSVLIDVYKIIFAVVSLRLTAQRMSKSKELLDLVLPWRRYSVYQLHVVIFFWNNTLHLIFLCAEKSSILRYSCRSGKH